MEFDVPSRFASRPRRGRKILPLAAMAVAGALHIAVGHTANPPAPAGSDRADDARLATSDADPGAHLVRALQARDERQRSADFAEEAGDAFAPRRIEARKLAPPWLTPLRAALEEEKDRQWVQVSAEALNLRAGPGVQAQRIGVLSTAARLLVQERQGAWVRVEVPDSGETGWVSSRFVEPLPPADQMAADAETADSGA